MLADINEHDLKELVLLGATDEDLALHFAWPIVDLLERYGDLIECARAARRLERKRFKAKKSRG